MQISRVMLSAAGAVAMLACSSGQTKSPVVTRSSGGTTVSPSGDAVAKRNTSLVRFVNALPGTGKLTVHADTRDLFGSVPYKTVTPYQELGENATKFALLNAGDGSEIANNSEVMSDGSRYTIFAMPDAKGGVSMRVTKDELLPDAGKARVRMIHAVPGISDLNLWVRGSRESLFNTSFGASSVGFKDVDPTTANFEIRSDKGDRPLIKLPSMTLVAGRAYTIVLAGTAPSKLAAITFDDAITPGATANVPVGTAQ